MNYKTIIGILLLGLGILVLADRGLSFTTTEKAIDLGPLQVTAERQHRLPPVFGVIALAGGALLIIAGGLSFRRPGSLHSSR